MIDLALEIAQRLIRRFEGCILSPYLCPAGVATIGYGSTRYEDGSSVSLTDAPITRARAEQMMLRSVLTEYLPAVRKLCPDIDSPDRLAAIIDFTYNLGASRLRASTLRRRINAGEWEAVPAELNKWVYAGGRPLNGLRLRRQAEAALIQ